eukprot:IDg19863t1
MSTAPTVVKKITLNLIAGKNMDVLSQRLEIATARKRIIKEQTQLQQLPLSTLPSPTTMNPIPTTSAFKSYRKMEPFLVQMGYKSTTTAVRRWNVTVPIIFDGVKRICILTDVLHVPDLNFSLISVSTLAERGICTYFSTSRVQIVKDSEFIATGTRSSGLYALD